TADLLVREAGGNESHDFLLSHRELRLKILARLIACHSLVCGRQPIDDGHAAASSRTRTSQDRGHAASHQMLHASDRLCPIPADPTLRQDHAAEPTRKLALSNCIMTHLQSRAFLRALSVCLAMRRRRRRAARASSRHKDSIRSPTKLSAVCTN